MDAAQAPQGVDYDAILQSVDTGQQAPATFADQRKLMQVPMQPNPQSQYEQMHKQVAQQIQQYMQYLQAMDWLKAMQPQTQNIPPGALEQLMGKPTVPPGTNPGVSFQNLYGRR